MPLWAIFLSFTEQQKCFPSVLFLEFFSFFNYFLSSLSLCSQMYSLLTIFLPAKANFLSSLCVRQLLSSSPFLNGARAARMRTAPAGLGPQAPGAAPSSLHGKAESENSCEENSECVGELRSPARTHAGSGSVRAAGGLDLRVASADQRISALNKK